MAWVERHGSGFRIRYRLPDGTLTSETGFETRTDAADRAADVESEQRTGTFVDPRWRRPAWGSGSGSGRMRMTLEWGRGRSTTRTCVTTSCRGSVPWRWVR